MYTIIRRIALISTVIAALYPAQGADPFTLVVLPDTQYYSDPGQPDHGGIPAMFNAQTTWIKNNKTSSNIKYVAHVGDIVDNANDTSQWGNADVAMDILDTAGVPYGVAPGNHDQDPNGDPSGSSTANYNAYFGLSRFSGKSWYGGHYGSNNDNHFDLFSASGYNFVVIYLEFDPTSSNVNAIAWADNILKTYPTRKGIVVSHYIGSPKDPADSNGSPHSEYGPQGARIYLDLRNNPNLFLMLSGHVDGTGRRVDYVNGRRITTCVQDFQFDPNGGSGYLRRFYFVPDNGMVYVSTYSPYYNTSLTGPDNNFVFPIDNAIPHSDPNVVTSTGRNAVFGISGGVAQMREQQVMDGAWDNWVTLGGSNLTQIEAVPYDDGRLAAFTVDTSGNIWVTAQNSVEAWSPWTNLTATGGGVSNNQFIKAIRYADGRLAVFSATSNGSISVRAQITYNGSWANWGGIGQPAGINLTKIDVVRLTDGRLAVFGVGAGTKIYHNIQTSYSSSWAGWNYLSGPSFANVSAELFPEDNRFIVGAVGFDSALYSIESQFNSGWNAWVNRGGGTFNTVHAAITKNSRVAFTAVSTALGVPYYLQQTAYNDTWPAWASLSGSGFKSAMGLFWNYDKMAFYGQGATGPRYIENQTNTSGGLSGWNNLGGTLIPF